MSELNDSEVLTHLEEVTDWENIPFVEADNELLLSLDTVCESLARAFADYLITTDFGSLTGDEFTQVLKEIAFRMNGEFNAQRDLQFKSVIQTRGDGVCLMFDESGQPGEQVLLSDDGRLRGTFIGIACLPILTNEALAGDETDATELLHEPTFCLVIKNTNITELGDVASFRDVIAIALRVGGVHIDQVITRESTTT